MTSSIAVSVASTPGHAYRQTIKAGNHEFIADITQKEGGDDAAASPHQMLLAALGACTNMTLQMYAQRKGWDVQSVYTDVMEKKDDATGKPHIIKDITITGNITEEQKVRLKSIAAKCPVNKVITGEKIMESTLELMG